MPATLPLLDVCSLTAAEIDDCIQISDSIAEGCLGDRAHNLEEDYSENISQTGVAAEYAAIKWLAISLGIPYKPIIVAWQQAAGNGRNYGQDLRGEWFGFPMPLEIKYTAAAMRSSTGILFMRPKSGDSHKGAGRMPRKYWIDTLPESIYVLLQQVKADSMRQFRVIGWALRDDFLKNYDTVKNINNELVLSHNSEGYPTITLHHSQLRPLSELLQLVLPVTA